MKLTKIINNIEVADLEELKLIHEAVLFRYADFGSQLHEIIGEQFTWALSHCPSLIEQYLDGEQLAPYEWLARRELGKEKK